MFIMTSPSTRVWRNSGAGGDGGGDERVIGAREEGSRDAGRYESGSGERADRSQHHSRAEDLQVAGLILKFCIIRIYLFTFIT